MAWRNRNAFLLVNSGILVADPSRSLLSGLFVDRLRWGFELFRRGFEELVLEVGSVLELGAALVSTNTDTLKECGAFLKHFVFENEVWWICALLGIALALL